MDSEGGAEMRIDFNQKGSWRKGPEFAEEDIEPVKDRAARLADLTNSDLRIVGDSGEVVSYRDPGKGWRENKTRGQELVPCPEGRRA